MKFVFFVFFAAVAGGLWTLRPILLDRGWSKAEWRATTAAIAAAIIALVVLFERGRPDPTTAAISFSSMFIIVNLARVAWSKIREFLGGGGGTAGHIRGAKIVDGKALQKILRTEAGTLKVGGQKIPERLESLHFLITGSTGTGKSVAISEILDGVAERGDRVMLADAGGNFLQNYYNPSRGDVILNPLDARAVAWSPLSEMVNEWDADQLAKSIIPTGHGTAEEWNRYAQSVAAAILKHCWRNHLSNADVFRIAVVAELAELREIFAGTPAQALVADGNERMFGSVRGIVGTYLSAFQYLPPDAGRDGWSLRKFVEDDRQKGWLFFNFRDDQLSTLSPVIAAMVDIAAKSILSLDANRDRKFWLVLDEFASLGKISSILDFLTKARKAGGRAIVGLQTVSQLRSAYGREDAQTLLSCLSSQLVLRCPDPETADMMSRLLGEQQISRVVASGGETSKFLESASQSTNWQQQISQERVVLPAELQNLPDLRGLLNLAGDIPAAPVELHPERREKVAPTFVAGERREIKIAPPPAPAQPQPEADPLADFI